MISRAILLRPSLSQYNAGSHRNTPVGVSSTRQNDPLISSGISSESISLKRELSGVNLGQREGGVEDCVSNLLNEDFAMQVYSIHGSATLLSGDLLQAVQEL